MFQRVKRNVDLGHPIEYDFEFNIFDHQKLFCSEFIRAGYEIASSGSVSIPAIFILDSALPSGFQLQLPD